MIALAVILMLSAAQPADCEQVKIMVKHHGKVASYAWALSQGYSPKEISRIRKQCGV